MTETAPTTETPKEVVNATGGTLLSTPAPTQPPTDTPPASPEKSETKQTEESYEIQAPEGHAYDAETLKVYTDTAKELGIQKDAAQKMYEKLGETVAARQQAMVQEVHAKWVEETKADPEIGGVKLEESVRYANKAIAAFGTDGLRTLLENSGLGNNRDVIAFLAKAGRAISEDKLLTKGTSVVTDSRGAAPAQDFHSMAARMYPKHAKEA
jgi:hypothetical protein